MRSNRPAGISSRRWVTIYGEDKKRPEVRCDVAEKRLKKLLLSPDVGQQSKRVDLFRVFPFNRLLFFSERVFRSNMLNLGLGIGPLSLE